jgi:hypothetical protein
MNQTINIHDVVDVQATDMVLTCATDGRPIPLKEMVIRTADGSTVTLNLFDNVDVQEV